MHHTKTGAGRPAGLMRGLLAAGGRSLLLSLWDVNDDSTANFMKAFYGNFDQAGDRATALQRALWAVRTDHRHPGYWAGFFLSVMFCWWYRVSLIQNDKLHGLPFCRAIVQIAPSALKGAI